MVEYKYFLPEHMTKEQETVLANVSNRLYSYGWKEQFIRRWWQTPAMELNNFCPLEALCVDKFDLVHRCLDRTVKYFERNLKEFENEQKLKRQALLD